LYRGWLVEFYVGVHTLVGPVDSARVQLLLPVAVATASVLAAAAVVCAMSAGPNGGYFPIYIR